LSGHSGAAARSNCRCAGINRHGCVSSEGWRISGRESHQGNDQKPCSLDSREEGNESREPIDKAVFRMVSESSGKQLEKPSSPRRETGGARNHVTGDTGKSRTGEWLAEGSAVAKKSGNADGAKGSPVCSDSDKTAGKGEMTKAAISLQDPRRSLYVKAMLNQLGVFGECTFMSARQRRFRKPTRWREVMTEHPASTGHVRGHRGKRSGEISVSDQRRTNHTHIAAHALLRNWGRLHAGRSFLVSGLLRSCVW
jgi:hypothetical protein